MAYLFSYLELGTNRLKQQQVFRVCRRLGATFQCGYSKLPLKLVRNWLARNTALGFASHRDIYKKLASARIGGFGCSHLTKQRRAT